MTVSGPSHPILLSHVSHACSQTVGDSGEENPAGILGSDALGTDAWESFGFGTGGDDQETISGTILVIVEGSLDGSFLGDSGVTEGGGQDGGPYPSIIGTYFVRGRTAILYRLHKSRNCSAFSGSGMRFKSITNGWPAITSLIEDPTL